MSPKKQIIEIAKACGWSHIQNANTMAVDGIWVGYPPQMQMIGQPERLPRYLTDLNAMHEAEKCLGELVEPYLDRLARLPPPLYGARATAEQRAEAFLKTIGKWEP